MSEIIWDLALIQKYNQSGPRYTSYPTALEFNENYTNDDFIAATQRYPARPLSLYVHIPFCHKLCYFCGCNKVITRHQHKADIYLDFLEKEIKERSKLFTNRVATQVHWGGGTPTYLTEEQSARLMNMLREHFNIAENAEVSIEMDPREIELSMLEHLRNIGFNRISMGVQDFNKDVQKAVNREQDEAFVNALLIRARELGFQSTNLDLIYGLPLQTVESFMFTLQKVIELNPDRLSIFNYAHLPSRFAGQAKIKDWQLPKPETKLDILQKTIQTLGNAGYKFIGMDHFAKPDDELAIAQQKGILHRNFQGYTTQEECDLLGLGVSAISLLGDTYAQNQKDLKTYYANVDETGIALHKGLAMTEEDCLRRDVIKQLICNFKLAYAPLEKQYHIDFKQHFAEDLALLAPLAADGLLEIGDEQIVVSAKGRLLIRNICLCFDTYSRAQAKQQQFSRII
ncbi:oxygen-independent coproporphyrinogen III oxidase [Aggregatibacter aphrophilus]|jgi:coproporphyrinogen dehydrogenase|uniref:Coproporphyrinogen-III oxidase n=2 Tax=Aggregatibacter aphrophilus TaxID=732 RepID=A0A336N6D3_AGGAP|nr:oxygen-independent coproporphyrinogen III oxidase [Aggregatibacter aphrophilus]KNE85170.1 coproporphyrinogen III oxidase [Aggregatibacter aphrophilus ATCC 33389]OBY53055.1 oxygen-independent coproporphyrinogen III oxidase [Aggregatibacter aphrophilus]PNL90382.1 oxygen-independent coproporphyrinogen III oxidase [Aggregatibacter aphrophilus]RDE88467.1 oxygen-independent coproporphyrinogen III oxidase [Aggregatibacter aphrophilus]SSZ29987.1 Oxygen-independent coproporphyrinogen-III oxidase [Ag